LDRNTRITRANQHLGPQPWRFTNNSLGFSSPVPSFTTPLHKRCSPPPPLAKESSSVGRALAHTYPHAHGLTHVNSILGQCADVCTLLYSQARRTLSPERFLLERHGFCAKTEAQHRDSKHDCTLCAQSSQHASPAKHALRERDCLSFASSADAGARRQGCDRALWLRAQLHTMRVCTMRELGAGQCTPPFKHVSRRRDL